MGVDVREQILERLKVVAGTVVPPGNVFRNRVNVPESKLPACVILDADEEADEADAGRGRPPLAPRIVAMAPEIYLLASNKGDDVGTDLNTLRARLIKAILTDNSLVELCHNGDIRYGGFATGLAAGRSLEGESGINFEFRYVLRPDKL